MTFHLPINPVSFGQVSINLLKELYKRGATPPVFAKGDINLSAFDHLDDNFKKWLSERLSYALSVHDRSQDTLYLWHISGLFESLSRENLAFTFHETNQLTAVEHNILRQQKKVLVSSNYTKKVFEEAGLNNVVYCPLGFDSDSFKKLPRDFKNDDKIVFGLRGKLEKRKHTLKILSAWSKKYGGNEKYRLDCSIQNNFMPVEQQEAWIAQALGGSIPWNINFLPFQAQNSYFNMVLNAVDIDLTGMSGCEGFNLPLFQSLCIGKQAVVLNAHVHKDFCDEKNSVLVDPSGMIDADDGVFFRKGDKFNQGAWFDFKEDDLIAAMETAEKSAKETNTEGMKLAERFTYKNTLDIIASL